MLDSFWFTWDAGEHLHLVPKDDDLDLQFAIRALMT
jgi:hypothetical protein